jgi:hypothetical protein
MLPLSRFLRCQLCAIGLSIAQTLRSDETRATSSDRVRLHASLASPVCEVLFAHVFDEQSMRGRAPANHVDARVGTTVLAFG